MEIYLDELKTVINRNTSFILTTHVNPDGDGIGSELALCHFLRKLSKRAEIINYSETPSYFNWMDPSHDIAVFKRELHGQKIQDTEVIFILDTNQPDRLRTMQPDVEKSKAIKIIIDHHLEPHSFAQYTYINPDVASTGEIIYKVLMKHGENVIDQQIARWLYAAIMTDTGSFRYPRTVSETYRIAANLLERGADPTEIYANVYETFSLGRMRLLGEVLDSMKTEYDGKLAYIVARQAWFKKTGTSEIDTDNFTIYPMSIKGVVVGILFNELPDGVKLSFRSKGRIPINELAKEFGGNGHLNAAGARVANVSLDGMIRKVIGSAEKYLNGKM
ncbi:MAG: bifunctional oligoribonuclease/PAP phosphatase NrnA [Bacteroidota bacterium]